MPPKYPASRFLPLLIPTYPPDDGGSPPTPLSISPTSVTVAALGSQTFTASGGTGGYTYSIHVNNSGGSINSSTGVYTAGPALADVTDTVRVTDGASAHADSHVTVTAAATGLAAWYDAGKDVTVSGSDVTKWADQSGNGFDLTPSGGDDKPTLHTGVVNGLPGLLFDTITGNAQLGNASAVVAHNSPRYVVAVLKPTVPTVGPQPAGFSWGGPFAIINGATTGLFYPVLGDYIGTLYVTGGSTTSPDPTTADTAYEYEWGSSGVPGALSVYLDGAPLTPSDLISYTDSTLNLVIGSDNGSGNASFCGYICEVLIYDHVLVGSELTAVRAYVNGKYAL